MTEELERTALHFLREELNKIRASVPNIRTFLFGSIINAKRPIADIDLLVVCGESCDCEAVRSGLAASCARFPIHLMLMTLAEEAELEFIKGVGASKWE